MQNSRENSGFRCIRQGDKDAGSEFILKTGSGSWERDSDNVS